MLSRAIGAACSIHFDVVSLTDRDLHWPIKESKALQSAIVVISLNATGEQRSKFYQKRALIVFA